MAVQQQQRQHDKGNNSGYGTARRYGTCTDGSGIFKCGDSSSNYFGIDLHMMAMAVAMATPIAEAPALQ
jgi:hypothetical protein